MLLRLVVVGWWEVVTLDVAPSESGVRVRSGPQRGVETARSRGSRAADSDDDMQ